MCVYLVRVEIILESYLCKGKWVHRRIAWGRRGHGRPGVSKGNVAPRIGKRIGRAWVCFRPSCWSCSSPAVPHEQSKAPGSCTPIFYTLPAIMEESINFYFGRFNRGWINQIRIRKIESKRFERKRNPRISDPPRFQSCNIWNDSRGNKTGQWLTYIYFKYYPYCASSKSVL